MDGICLFRVNCVLMIVLFGGIHTDRVERIGNHIVPSASTIKINSTVFLLDDIVLQDGVVFAFSAYFRTTKKVSFQIWRPSNDSQNSHKLVSYLEAKSSIVNGREDIYVASRLVLPCTRVRTGDRLGVFFPESPSGISYVFDGSRATALGAEVDNINEMYSVGQSRKFDPLPFPYTFSAAAYVDTNLTMYPDNEEYPDCPDLLIPEHLRPELPDLPIAPGANGSTGAPGWRGSQGRDGVIGLQGARGTLVGYTGATGPAGQIGTRGEQGEQGIDGILGLSGEVGATGMQGQQGEQGDVGLQGPQGPTGTFVFTTPYLPFAELKSLTTSNAHIGLLIWLFIVTAGTILLLIIVIVVCLRRRREWEADEGETLIKPKKQSGTVKKYSTLEYTPDNKPTITYDEIDAPSTLPRSRPKENIYSDATLQSINSLKPNANNVLSQNGAKHRSNKNSTCFTPQLTSSNKNSPYMAPRMTSTIQNNPLPTPPLGSRPQYLGVDLDDQNGSWASAINEIYATKLKTDDVISFQEKKTRRHKKDTGFNMGDMSHSTDTLDSYSSFIDDTPKEHELTYEEIHNY